MLSPCLGLREFSLEPNQGRHIVGVNHGTRVKIFAGFHGSVTTKLNQGHLVDSDLIRPDNDRQQG